MTYSYNPTVGTTFGMFSASSPLVLPVDQRLEEAYSRSWTSTPLAEPIEITPDGTISPPSGPGLGVTLDLEALERYRVG